MRNNLEKETEYLDKVVNVCQLLQNLCRSSRSTGFLFHVDREMAEHLQNAIVHMENKEFFTFRFFLLLEVPCR